VIELLSAGAKDGENRFRGLHRNCALLHDDLRPVRHVRNHPGHCLDEPHIGRPPGAHTEGFCRRIDADKNNVRPTHRIMHPGREEQISTTSGFYDIVQAGFIHRKVSGIPGVNSLLIEIDYFHPDIGAF
jgi:hypothetical protein